MKKFQIQCMKTNCLKTLLSSLLAIILLANSPLISKFIIGKDTTALAAKTVDATFYLVDEDEIIKLFPNVSLSGDYLIKIGTGKINYSNMILDNSKEVQSLIVEAPSNSNYNWKHVVYYQGQYLVGASLSEVENNISNSDSKPSDVTPNTTPNTTPQATIHSLNRNQILNLSDDSYPTSDSVVWDGFIKGKRDLADGVIPMNLIDDPVYTSMNLPSESRSQFMIDAWRDNGHIIGDTSSEKGTHLLGMGSLYQTANKKMTENMRIALGKIKTFGYNKYSKKWEIIGSDPYPKAAMIYTLPWDNSKIYSVPIEKYSDHITVVLKDTDLTNKTLHFWGSRPAFDRTKYSYYACAYDFWTVGNNYATGSVTAVNGIDIKTESGSSTISQLTCSRGMTVQYKHKTVWSTTIPNDKYQESWGAELQALYDK